MSFEIKFHPLALEELPARVAALKKQGYRFVQMLCTNTDDGLDVQYSFMKDGVLENFTITGVKKGTKVPSITDKYLAAFVFENESHDLFGLEVEGIAIDFGGNFYQVSVAEPMTVISPAQKEAREKAAKIAAAKAAKAAKAAQTGEAVKEEGGE